MTSVGVTWVEICVYSGDGPFDGISPSEGHREGLHAILTRVDAVLEPIKNPIKKGDVCVPTPRTVKQEPKDPEDSGVDTISDSESETSCSHGDLRTPHKKGSARSLASPPPFSSAYIIKSTDRNGGPRGNGAAGISSNGESSRSTPNGGSTTGGGGGNQSNKRKHHDDQGPGRSKKPHVSDPQEPDLASPCVFFIAEPNASKFQEGGSHVTCRTKTFTKISDHNQHNNRRHPPLWCPKCKSEIINTEKAHQDHQNRCGHGGQLQQNKAQAEEPNDRNRCRCFKDVAERWLGDLSAYPKVISDIEFRKAPVDIADAFRLFMQQDPAARNLGDAIRGLFFRSPQFVKTAQKHDILNEFKSGSDPYPDWDVGDISWKTLWRGIPEAPGTSNLSEGVGIDKSTTHNKNQSFEAASETGGNDTSTETGGNDTSTGTLPYPASIPDAHCQPTADPMNSSPPSNPQLRTHKANKSSSSQLPRESNPPRNSSQTPRQHPSRQLRGKGSATARKEPRPSGLAATTSHTSGIQAPSTPTTSHERQGDQWGQTGADQTQSRPQGCPPQRPDTQVIQAFHSTMHDQHCAVLGSITGGDQVGVGTPPTDPGQDSPAPSGANTKCPTALGNLTNLESADSVNSGDQATTGAPANTQDTQPPESYTLAIEEPPNDAQYRPLPQQDVGFLMAIYLDMVTGSAP